MTFSLHSRSRGRHHVPAAPAAVPDWRARSEALNHGKHSLGPWHAVKNTPSHHNSVGQR